LDEFHHVFPSIVNSSDIIIFLMKKIYKLAHPQLKLQRTHHFTKLGPVYIAPIEGFSAILVVI